MKNLSLAVAFLLGINAAAQPLTYVGECTSSSRCGLCEGDCDDHDDCTGDLLCFERSGIQAVPGCTGTGVSAKDYCYDYCANFADGDLCLIGDEGSPSKVFPLGVCEGKQCLLFCYVLSFLSNHFNANFTFFIFRR